MKVTMVERVPLVWRTDAQRLERMLLRAMEAHEHSGMEKTAVFTNAVDVYLRGMWGGTVELSMSTQQWDRDRMVGSDVVWVEDPDIWLKTGCTNNRKLLDDV